jgi:phosphatidylcholine synthase
MTFAPVRFVHPLRVVRLRLLNIALLAVWAALALVTIAMNLEPGFYVTVPLTVIALYFLVAGWLPQAK